MNDNLRCPRCFSPLVLGKDLRKYQNLMDHVCSPNSPVPFHEYFICSSEICPTRVVDDFWDPYGDYYTNQICKRDFFLLDCDKALYSGSRQFELQKHKKEITFLHLIYFKAYIELTPRWDPPGIELIGYSPKIKMCVRSIGDKSWTMYTPGIHMFFYCLRTFNEKFDRYIADPSNDYLAKELMDGLIRDKWDKRWWKLLSIWCNNLKAPGLRESLKNKFNE